MPYKEVSTVASKIEPQSLYNELPDHHFKKNISLTLQENISAVEEIILRDLRTNIKHAIKKRKQNLVEIKKLKQRERPAKGELKHELKFKIRKLEKQTPPEIDERKFKELVDLSNVDININEIKESIRATHNLKPWRRADQKKLERLTNEQYAEEYYHELLKKESDLKVMGLNAGLFTYSPTETTNIIADEGTGFAKRRTKNTTPQSRFAR